MSMMDERRAGTGEEEQPRATQGWRKATPVHDRMSSRRVSVTGPLKGNAAAAEVIHAPSFCATEVGFYLAVEERTTGSLLFLRMPPRRPPALGQHVGGRSSF